MRLLLKKYFEHLKTCILLDRFQLAEARISLTVLEEVGYDPRPLESVLRLTSLGFLRKNRNDK